MPLLYEQTISRGNIRKKNDGTQSWNYNKVKTQPLRIKIYTEITNKIVDNLAKVANNNYIFTLEDVEKVEKI